MSYNVVFDLMSLSSILHRQLVRACGRYCSSSSEAFTLGSGYYNLW